MESTYTHEAMAVPRSARREWMPAGIAIAMAAALSMAVMWWLLEGPRRWLLLNDGDTVLPALMWNSVQSGQPQSWALSSVLFIPELALYWPLVTLGLSARVALLANGVVNLLALFLALRYVAGLVVRPGERWRAWLVALGALTVSVAVIVTERSADRNVLELFSLQATTTYYAPTVVACLVLAGVAARVVLPASEEAVFPWGLLAVHSVVLAFFAMSNPLIVAWSAAPLVVVVLYCFGAGATGRRRAAALTVSTMVAAGVAYVLRIPFADVIVANPMLKVRPENAGASASYFFGLLADRAATAGGIVAIILCAAGLAAPVWILITLRDPRHRSVRLISAIALAFAGGSIVFAVSMGTQAARYLQPVAFGALIGFVAALSLATRSIRRPQTRLLRSGLALALGAALCVSLGALPAMGAAGADLDPDERCVARWIETSGSNGAGEFWVIRGIKAGLQQPSQLVQTDYYLNRYVWLTNRADLSVDQASFIVTRDDEYLKLPDQEPDGIVTCGPYSIVDFRTSPVRLGPSHS